MNKSFRDGLSDFYARLLDAERSPIGSIQPQEKLDERLLRSVQTCSLMNDSYPGYVMRALSML
jgi:hypothetical protein